MGAPAKLTRLRAISFRQTCFHPFLLDEIKAGVRGLAIVNSKLFRSIASLRSSRLKFSGRRSRSSISKLAESGRWAAMAFDAFKRRGDREESWFLEGASEEFQSNRHLDFFRPFQPAAVWISIVRHAIVDFSGESGRYDDGRKAGFGAETHREARARTSVGVEVGLQHRLAGYQCRIGHDRPGFENSWLGSVSAVFARRLVKMMGGGIVV